MTTEARLQVDRKKLEELLQLKGSNNNRVETADGFFQRIMRETNTQIFWPSQLKIGARSKKDPNIKICGYPDAVYSAREKIIQVLYTKRNKVTLKMDVSFTDHSHVIGKCGKNVKRIMEETGCHIHFPDSNRTGQGEKSNQVSVTGEPVGVEKARSMIRDLLPLVITFDVPVTGYFQPIPDPTSQEMQIIQNKFGFTVSFRHHNKDGSTTVQVRCSQDHFSLHKEGILFLMKSYLMKSKVELPVRTQIEILPPHQSYLLDKGFRNIELIKQMTGVDIVFPGSPSLLGTSDYKKTTVGIFGSIESVFWAWKKLMNCLPLTLIFDLREGQEIDACLAGRLSKKQNFSFIIKPKPKFNTKTVILKGVERDSRLLLDTRQYLLQLEPLNYLPDKEEITLASLLLSNPSDICLRSSLLQAFTWNKHFTENLYSQTYSSLLNDHSNFTQLTVPNDVGFNSQLLETKGSTPCYNSTQFPLQDNYSNLIGVEKKKDVGSVGCERKNNLNFQASTDYGHKKVLATKAMQRDIISENHVQVPSSLWSGHGFSQSMPASSLRYRHSSFNHGSDEGTTGSDSSQEDWTLSKCLNNNLDFLEMDSLCNGRGESAFAYSNFFEAVLPKPLADSEFEDLPNLLCRQGLSEYVNLFLQQEIDLPTFLTMTDRDFQDLGIRFVVRRKMSSIISEINRQCRKFY